MKILSLFDGMSCAAIALTELGIPLTRYVAFENDPHAVKASLHNFFLEAEPRGEITPDTDFSEFEGFDFVMGGSPCTHWSIAQSPGKRETTASGIGWELFQHYVRAVEQAKPKYFIYENNKSMSKDIRNSIDEAFGFEAILINSALVSAQQRNRLYWVGKRNEQGGYDKVNIEQPEDRGILLKDILDGVVAMQDKSYALTTRCNGATIADTLEKKRHTMAGQPVCVNSQSGDRYGKRPQPSVHDRIYDENGKHPCLHTAHQPSIAIPVTMGQPTLRYYLRTCNQIISGQVYGVTTPNGEIEVHKVYSVKEGRITISIKGEPRIYPIKLTDGYYIIRKLTVSECMRLQQVPEWYDFSAISNTQAYKCLGNGWSVEVIKHLIQACLFESTI